MILSEALAALVAKFNHTTVHLCPATCYLLVIGVWISFHVTLNRLSSCMNHMWYGSNTCRRKFRRKFSGITVPGTSIHKLPQGVRSSWSLLDKKPAVKKALSVYRRKVDEIGVRVEYATNQWNALHRKPAFRSREQSKPRSCLNFGHSSRSLQQFTICKQVTLTAGTISSGDFCNQFLTSFT